MMMTARMEYCNIASNILRENVTRDSDDDSDRMLLAMITTRMTTRIECYSRRGAALPQPRVLPPVTAVPGAARQTDPDKEGEELGGGRG